MGTRRAAGRPKGLTAPAASPRRAKLHAGRGQRAGRVAERGQARTMPRPKRTPPCRRGHACRSGSHKCCWRPRRRRAERGRTPRGRRRVHLTGPGLDASPIRRTASGCPRPARVVVSVMVAPPSPHSCTRGGETSSSPCQSRHSRRRQTDRHGTGQHGVSWQTARPPREEPSRSQAKSQAEAKTRAPETRTKMPKM